MNKILLFLLLSALPLQAEIIETNHMADALPYINGHTLLFFNVSDTLYEPATALADNQWRLYFAKLVQQTISEPAIAERFINQIKNLIVNHVPKRAVEPYTVRLISDLQKEQQPVLGITKKCMSSPYAANFGEITHNHLLSIGIDLEKTLAYLPVSDQQDDTHTFAFGIIFTNKQPEGPALISFLKKIKWQPKRVVMVDNSRQSLENVEAALKETAITFIGVRYGRCDGRRLNFDPDVGTIQFFEYLKKGRIMFDEEARQFKLSHPGIQYESLLVEYIRSNAGKT